MTQSLRIGCAAACLALLLIGAQGAMGAPESASEGKLLLEQNCSRCHSIADKGESPLPKAPPLRDIYLRYPIEQLEEGFAEGMGSKTSRHAANSILRRAGRRHPHLSRQHHERRPGDPAARARAT